MHNGSDSVFSKITTELMRLWRFLKYSLHPEISGNYSSLEKLRKNRQTDQPTKISDAIFKRIYFTLEVKATHTSVASGDNSPSLIIGYIFTSMVTDSEASNRKWCSPSEKRSSWRGRLHIAEMFALDVVWKWAVAGMKKQWEVSSFSTSHVLSEGRTNAKLPSGTSTLIIHRVRSKLGSGWNS